MHFILVLIAFSIILGCSTGTHRVKSGNGNVSNLIPCTAPRPEVCTQEYIPVCGKLGDGNQKTYSNACSACADSEVVNYQSGPCQ
ncbi:MAG: hypothetical protein JRJ37_00080 [Deltaproteobacteria bacterium]|nr:hypothetical protein [Deltaproteobacteria bacterium]MBW1848439.1 hypothetical protein [Deltaproteobacteria bacterium]